MGSGRIEYKIKKSYRTLLNLIEPQNPQDFKKGDLVTLLTQKHRTRDAPASNQLEQLEAAKAALPYFSNIG